MGRKIIISEKQLGVILESIQEDNIRKVVKYLDKHYEPAVGTYREGGEYHNKTMITNLADNEMLTPRSLVQHLKYKFNLNDEFLQQIVRDWFDGNFKNTKEYSLSRNISM